MKGSGLCKTVGLKLVNDAMPKTLSVVDLFAGVGGLTLGFLRANHAVEDFAFAPRLLVDQDRTAAHTFKKNYPKIPYWATDLNSVSGGDVLGTLKMKPGEVDFLVGGPPCQGFSSNGKRWLEDNRNKLMQCFIDIAHEVNPKCFIIENVPIALSAWQKMFSEQIQEAFRGYTVAASVLNASQFGVPQIRRRAFIVGIRSDLGVPSFNFPQGDFDAMGVGQDSHNEAKVGRRFVSVEDAIGDLPPLAPGEEIDGIVYPSEAFSDYQRERRAGWGFLFNHRARAHSKKFQDKISIINPGEGNAHLPDEQKFSDNYFSQAYARLHAKGIGFTITAHFRNPGSGRFTHYRDVRSITVREAARLQSFDDKFIFHLNETDQERHVGNAVPPLMAEALAKHFGRIIAET